MQRWLWILFVVLMAPIGCDKSGSNGSDDGSDDDGDDASESSGGVPEKKKKVKTEWIKAKRKFQVKGKKKLYGDVSIFQGAYQVTIHGFPKGTAWSVGEDKGTVDSRVFEIIKIKEMQDQFGQIPIDKLKKFELDPKASLEVIMPNGNWFELELPATTVGLSIDHVLKKVENGPVKFGDEKGDPKPGTSVLFMYGLTWKVFGQASLLSDVDAIAMARLLDEVKSTKKCTGYRSNDKKPMPDIQLQLKETEVIIYDRRKGGEMKKKVFPPDDDCPSFTFQRKGENKTDSSIPSKKIESWLRSVGK